VDKMAKFEEDYLARLYKKLEGDIEGDFVYSTYEKAFREFKPSKAVSDYQSQLYKSVLKSKQRKAFAEQKKDEELGETKKEATECYLSAEYFLQNDIFALKEDQKLWSALSKDDKHDKIAEYIKKNLELFPQICETLLCEIMDKIKNKTIKTSQIKWDKNKHIVKSISNLEFTENNYYWS
jgi:hypothetical protein